MPLSGQGEESMSTIHQTEIEFFGGPCDGHRQAVSGRVDELKFVTAIPLPFEADRSWLKRAWPFATKNRALYSLDCSLDRCGYHYLRTLGRRKAHRRNGSWRRLRWLSDAFERRFQILSGSGCAS